jgi:DNA adenine methylase
MNDFAQTIPSAALPVVLKWVGSKRQQCPRLVEVIKPLLRPGAVYIEPFAGSLAPFFALRQSGWNGSAALGDLSYPLINFWEELRFDREQLWNYCSLLLEEESGLEPWRREEIYYKHRKQFNCTGTYSKSYRAALFLYLNQRGFNGLWRTNKKGELTTAYGGPRKAFPTKETLAFASKLLKHSTFHHSDFESLLKLANPGDVVYCDPPYNGTYTGYSGTFRTKEQQRLATTLKNLHRSGVHIIASNADTEGVRAVYYWAKIEPIEVIYGVKGGDQRKAAKELLISAVAS